MAKKIKLGLGGVSRHTQCSAFIGHRVWRWAMQVPMAWPHDDPQSLEAFYGPMKSDLTGHPTVDRRKAPGRWTRCYAGGHEYRQLDDLLLSKSLTAKNTRSPEIMRMGRPFRAEDSTGKRFENVGQDNPKASDHCPVVMELEI